MSEILREACARLEERESIGRERYGDTVDRRDMTAEQWLEHLRQELEDAVLYAPTAAREIMALRAERDELLEALGGLFANPHVELGDLVYDVREAEGQGWEAPAVKQWSDAVTRAREALSRFRGICPTCKGHGMIGGPSFYQPDEGGMPCPDCRKEGA